MNKDIIVAVVIVVAASTVAGFFLVQNSRQVASRPEPIDANPSMAPVTETPPQLPPRKFDLPTPRAVNQTAPAVAQPTTKPLKSPPAPKPRGNTAPAPVVLSEPEARQALALVGADPDAEAAWSQAINDPNFSPSFRKDLIEDLNDQGYENLRQLTPNDLILVERRLAIVEELAPNAMDETNLRAFAEAYKDLRNMQARGAGN